MLYTIRIDQKAISEMDLLKYTDFKDWIIISYVFYWYFSKVKNVKRRNFNGKSYMWLNYLHMIEENPLLKIKTKPPITNRFNKIRKLKLLETYQSKENSLYVRPASIELVKKWYGDSNAIVNQWIEDETYYRQNNRVLLEEEQPVLSGVLQHNYCIEFNKLIKNQEIDAPEFLNTKDPTKEKNTSALVGDLKNNYKNDREITLEDLLKYCSGNSDNNLTLDDLK